MDRAEGIRQGENGPQDPRWPAEGQKVAPETAQCALLFAAHTAKALAAATAAYAEQQRKAAREKF
jgi:hypothetical protein